MTIVIGCLDCGTSAAPPADIPQAADEPASDPPRCRDDAECVVTSFDCSECGRCPGDPPWAALPAEMATAEEECRRNPPVRNNPQAAAMGLQVPACQPCDGGLPQEFVTLYRAVCRDGFCIAEPYATEPVQPSGGLLAPDTPILSP
jgi:hypothetical protein